MIGMLALVVAFGPLVAGSWRLRGRLLPTWAGPPGWLVQFVVVLTSCLVAILLLGTIGWYSLVPTTTLLALFGIGTWLVAGRLEVRATAPLAAPPERLGRPVKVVAVVALACVAATWGARTYVALSHGMVSIDSLWYHLPLAARYSHLHSITGIYHDVDDLSGFYPVNGELVHSLGMVLLGNDLLSMVLNLGWGAVALVAAWCIGRVHGVGAVCVTALSVLLCAPAFLGTQPGAAHVDIVGVALLLTAAALLVTADPRRVTTDRVVLALCAMLVGFAVGTKWTLVPVAVLLTLGIIVLLPRGVRLRVAAMWLGIVAVLGSFSYVRNLLRVGSPVPPVDLKVGPIGWDRKSAETEGMSSLSKVLFDADAWTHWLLPGLSQWFGYAWWAALALVFVGWGLAIATGPGAVTRMLGVVAALAFVAYVVQPQLLLIGSAPYYFAANLRYGSAAMAFGLVLLPLSPLLHRRRVLLWGVAAASLIIVVVMQFDSAVWPVELRDLRWENPVRGADVVAGIVAGVLAMAIGLGWLAFGPRLRRLIVGRRPRTGSVPSQRVVVASIVVLVVLVVGTLGLDRFYLQRRYARPDAATPFLDEHWRAWKWARGIRDARIGYLKPALSYPLYGNRLTNTIEVLPVTPAATPGALRPDTPTACSAFQRAVESNALDYVVLYGSLAPVRDLPAEMPSFEQTIPEVAWLAADPNATKVLSAPLEAVFRLDGPLDPAVCDARG